MSAIRTVVTSRSSPFRLNTPLSFLTSHYKFTLCWKGVIFQNPALVNPLCIPITPPDTRTATDYNLVMFHV